MYIIIDQSIAELCNGKGELSIHETYGEAEQALAELQSDRVVMGQQPDIVLDRYEICEVRKK